MQSRIDRAMATDDWFELFPYGRLFHLNREWSDHAPLKVVFDRRLGEEGGPRRKFRFEHVWVEEEGCEATIKRAWEHVDSDVLETIERCARDLHKWKGVSIGKVVKELRSKRLRLQKLNEGGRSVREVEERRRVNRDISKLLRQEELFWRQRSRAISLKEGDKNTKIFHRRASQRKQRNHIHRLITDEGTVV
ncbi:uncharacterized protein LOC141627941 [Silene latifolia]|uniref:uncharacterized protein LOC141627941 n=1 Tax=Silene latifolia TaxID=37657 RepID=UPI003D770777